MACHFPLRAWRRRDGDSRLTFRSDAGLPNTELSIPCGQCIGCRLDKSRKWAIRCQHEASLYEKNCFVTLTYSDESLPLSDEEPFLPTLRKRDLSLFFKRLRKRFGSGIRFYACGEYGPQTLRPHYHACIFNFDFHDRIPFSLSNGNVLYTSEILDSLWPFGHCLVGDVTFESACYVARYIMKKVLGPSKDAHYNGREPDFTVMSRRPGIGSDWIRQNMDDVYSYDSVVSRGGVQSRPPAFYDSRFELVNPEKFAELKAKRRLSVQELSPERMIALEDSARIRTTRFLQKL